MSLEPTALAPVAWLTDVEGRWDKIESFARDNPCVSLSPEGALTVAPGARFVFGGDAIDRGPDGRRVVRTLLDAHRRQPDQVILLAGNRDINKLRLPRELAGHPPGKTPTDVREGPRPALLQWILANTMGARGAFEHRRTELTREGQSSDDESVTESFLADIAPEGELTAYLSRCQLALRLGPSLFVHGFVTPQNLGVVPGLGAPVEDLDAWIAALNGWYRDQLAMHRNGVMNPDGTPGCAPVVAYQAPVPGSKANDGSVVYARPTDVTGTPYLPGQAVITALTRAGVRRLLVGHTPCGDTPAILRGDGFELVLADNSYGRLETGSRVVLHGEGLEVHGRTRLDDGSEVDVRFDSALDDGDPWLGQREEVTQRLVKARLSTGEYALFRAMSENRVEQLAVAPEALRGCAMAPPRRIEK